ncbi:MAG: haloacid dehalogenase type II [Acidimicrobiia bacterium]|nr:haloacid dehalogenase type II [Acidimicrobiia bacterium]
MLASAAVLPWNPSGAADGVSALTFDVFGTVVDWRGSIIAEGAAFNRARGKRIDWARFADRWRAGYGPSMNLVRKGELPWMTIDQLHRRVLDQLLVEFQLEDLDEAARDHLNRAWHRLKPWPDGVAGLTRLKKKFIIATLSNGNVALLTNMAKNAGLPWDCILSAELARHYKPDPEAYLTAASLLGLKPAQVMMVAAHKGDLKAAKAVGFHTAFVPRPKEYGPDREPETKPDESCEIVARDFLDLANQLGAPK